MGQNFSFGGQLSALHVSKIENPWQSLTGLRYIPELKGGLPVGDAWKFDLEASLNAYGSLGITLPDSMAADANLKPYRIWARMATERAEVRLGLQKINFGSATMLRPLMWFDQMDPRDPLQLTDGVYSALGRYFFQNNANIWLWLVLPSKSVKGWEYFRSDRNRPEFGGRFQFPAGKGELALSGHFRTLGIDQSNVLFPITPEKPVPEYRIGLDGKWDVGPGIWFEGSLTHTDLPIPEMNNTLMMTIGADYTLPIGSGLTAMTEQFAFSSGKSLFRDASGMVFSALSLTYPISLTHSLSAMVYYNWAGNNWYRFINWGISLRKFSLYLIAFWNPESLDLYRNTGNSGLMGGKGAQLIFVWNH